MRKTEEIPMIRRAYERSQTKKCTSDAGIMMYVDIETASGFRLQTLMLRVITPDMPLRAPARIIE